MIYELNRLRSDPPRYAKLFIKDLLADAIADTGKTSLASQYSVSYTYENNKVARTDTTWQDSHKEYYKALITLYDTLVNLKPLPILLPDKGIYYACENHAKDQVLAGKIEHQGTDGSWPWDRIIKASPTMNTGNENIACGPDDVRQIVLQLLVDSGISNYGHRYNMLDEKWTHAACYEVGKLNLECRYWIQNFGKEKK